MDINFVNLYGLLTAASSVLVLLLRVPYQFRVSIKFKDGFTHLRWGLLAQLVLCAGFIGTRIPYFMGRITVDSPITANIWVSLATSTAIFLFALNMVQIYTYKEKK